MPDLLVISHAATNAVNRNIYIKLQELGWNTALLIPESIQFSSGRKAADTKRTIDPVIYLKPLLGNNPRTYIYEGLTALLDELKPKIVLLDNDPVSRLAVEAGKWCRKNNRVLVCQSCENLAIDLRSSFQRGGIKSIPAAVYKYFLKRRSLPLVTSVFTISKEGTTVFEKMGYKNVCQIPLGFNPCIFFPNEGSRKRIRNELQLNKPVIAYFGRLTKEKGVHLLIEALAGLKDLEWTFMIDRFDLYATSYHVFLQQLISDHGIADRVVYIDAGHEEIAEYMNAADAVIVPSISTPKWKEQYGRVASEAMACGKVVIVSASGTLPELVGECGIVFPEGDIVALKNELKRYLNNPGQFNYLKTEAAKRAKEYLSLPTQAAIMNNMLHQLITSKVMSKN